MTKQEMNILKKLTGYAASMADGALTRSEGQAAELLADRGELIAAVEEARAVIRRSELKPGAEVDAPRHCVFGGVIKKIKGKTAYVDIYEATEGTITRRFAIGDLEATQ